MAPDEVSSSRSAPGLAIYWPLHNEHVLVENRSLLYQPGIFNQIEAGLLFLFCRQLPRCRTTVPWRFFAGGTRKKKEKKQKRQNVQSPAATFLVRAHDSYTQTNMDDPLIFRAFYASVASVWHDSPQRLQGTTPWPQEERYSKVGQAVVQNKTKCTPTSLTKNEAFAQPTRPFPAQLYYLTKNVGSPLVMLPDSHILFCGTSFRIERVDKRCRCIFHPMRY